MRETTAHLSQNIQCSSGDSNWASLVLFQTLAVEVCIYLLLGLSRYFLLVWYCIILKVLYILILYHVNACLKNQLPAKKTTIYLRKHEMFSVA